ncbi:MAG: DUF2520 domain-containing protein [Acidobacteriota bacterium]|nr:DUF2520 domain-containing protein [Acidobacteriota bacterium]
MRKHTPIRSIAIIGPGRIGQAMGRLLMQSRVPIAFIAARKLAAARRAVGFIGEGVPSSLADPRLLSASVLLITTSDSAIGEVAFELAKLGKGRDAWRNKVVLHTCGSLPSDVLRPLKLRGAAIGSLHPFQTVPSPQAGVRNLRGCFWALEGDRPALLVARDWVKRLGGVAFSIRPREKALYHLSAFIVCPTVVTLMAQAASLLKQAGVPAGISRPMLRQFVGETAKNFADMGPRRALTGPAVRGDWATIRRHLAALKRSAPGFVPVYQSLLKAMLALAAKGQKQVKRQNAKGKR